MGITIEDGKGTGNLSGVTSENRLETSAVTTTALEFAALSTNSFYFNTGFVILTSANESAVAYVKNTHPTLVLQIAEVIYSFGHSTDGYGDLLLRAYFNSTGGSILSSNTPLVITNRNLGSSVPAQAVALTGQEGSTITGGTLAITRVYFAPTYDVLSPGIIIPNGSNLTLSFQPPTANTSLNVSISVIAQYIDPTTI